MKSKQFEIEVKVLLGNKNFVDGTLQKLKENDPHFAFVGKTSQLNHYFTDGDPTKLCLSLTSILTNEKVKEVQNIFATAATYSLRTRWEDGTTKLVLKASTHGTDSVHDIRRLEFEEVVFLPLDKLDQSILSAGFSYQSKWSREREKYGYKDLTVCIDKNAGYGYLAEFEKVIYNENDIEKTKKAILEELTRLNLEELPNDRLNRMFSHYNIHWNEYYQTDKTFTIL